MVSLELFCWPKNLKYSVLLPSVCVRLVLRSFLKTSHTAVSILILICDWSDAGSATVFFWTKRGKLITSFMWPFILTADFGVSESRFRKLPWVCWTRFISSVPRHVQTGGCCTAVNVARSQLSWNVPRNSKWANIFSHFRHLICFLIWAC